MTDLWAVPDFYTEAIANANPPDWTAFTMADYYSALGRAYPDYRFAQFNFRFDNVQQRYFAIGAPDPRAYVGENLPATMQLIAESTPNFSYYIGNDTQHCILPTAGFYTIEVDGVPARDWIWNVAQGHDVVDVDVVAED
jgi:hypothetical protein